MMILDDFQNLQRKVETAKRERDQEQGARSALIDRLKREYNCKGPEAATKLREELRDKLQVILDEYLPEKKEFENRYREILEAKRG